MQTVRWMQRLMAVLSSGFNGSSFNAATVQPMENPRGNFTTTRRSCPGRIIRLNSDGSRDDTFSPGSGRRYGFRRVQLLFCE